MRFERPTGLMFHHFHGGKHPVSQGSIGAEDFDQILDFVQKDHEILPARKWLARATTGTLSEHDVCVTFDDTLACQYDIALPVLAERNVTAFWFVYSSVLEGGIEPLEIFRLFRTTCFSDIEDFYALFFAQVECEFGSRYGHARVSFNSCDYLEHAPFYSYSDRWFRYLRDQTLTFAEYKLVMERMMDEVSYSIEDASEHLWLSQNQVRDLAEDGHVIGLHSHTHPTTMAKLPVSEQFSEYSRNSDSLFRILGVRAETVSHPCNSYCENTLDILRELGARVGFRANTQDIASRSALEYDREDHANILRIIRESWGMSTGSGR